MVDINTNYRNIINEIENMSDIKKIVYGRKIFVVNEYKGKDMIELFDTDENNTVIFAIPMSFLRDELLEDTNKIINRLVSKYNK